MSQEKWVDLSIALDMKEVKRLRHAREHEKRRTFKRLLRVYTDQVIGDYVNDWRAFPHEPPKKWDDVNEAYARKTINEFIDFVYDKHDRDRKAMPQVEEEDPTQELCRMTSSGWVREYAFRLNCKGSEDFLKCKKMVAAYEALAEAQVTEEQKTALEKVTIHVQLSAWFPHGEMPSLRSSIAP